MIHDADAITELFTRSDGVFRFSRWGRPLAPMVYGTNDQGVRLFEREIAAVAKLAGLPVAELDPETAANFMVFFVSDWADLLEIPPLAEVLPDLEGLAKRLGTEKATHYRLFGFDDDGAIGICLNLIRYGPELQKVSAQTLALTQAFQGILLWADGVFEAHSPVAVTGDDGRCTVKPWFARVLAAAYDPVLPSVSLDASIALRIAARMTPETKDEAAGEAAEEIAEQVAEAVAAATHHDDAAEAETPGETGPEDGEAEPRDTSPQNDPPEEPIAESEILAEVFGDAPDLQPAADTTVEDAEIVEDTPDETPRTRRGTGP